MRLSALRLLEEVGAQGGLDDGEEGAQDPVLVERGDLVERPVELFEETVDQLGAGALAAGRHPGLEEGDQQTRGVDVVTEGVLHVVLAEGRTGLPHVLRVRAQHHRLPPVQTGAEHQGVEAVVLGLAGPHRGERVLEAVAGVVGEVVATAVDLRHPQTEVVDPGMRTVGAAQLVRTLVDDLDTQPLERREDGGQGDLLAGPVDLEAALAQGGADRLVQAEREVLLVVLERFEVDQVGDGGARRVVGLVALGEGVPVAPQQLGGTLLAALGVQRLLEAVGPGAGGLDETGLDAVLLGVGEVGQLGAGCHTDDEVQPGQDRLGVPGGEVDAGAAELLLQDVDQPEPHAGGVTVARQVDDR